MGDYAGYQAYKPSNVCWLGDIPEHWDVWKVTHGFSRIGSGTTPKSDNPIFYDGNVPWVTTSELREAIISDTAQKVTEEAVASYSALKIYPKGSLAIAMYGATIGRLGMLGVDATFNQACCVFAEPTVFDTRFVYYWLWMRRPILISLSNGGGQPNLSQDDLKKLWIPIPDIPEQQTIARFLDFKTRQIDALIAKKKALLDKLAEKRTALISHAVTKGLDPTVAMKDSEVAWLGNIPAHWEVKRTKFTVSYIGSGKTPKGGSEVYVQEGIMILRSQNVHDKGLRLDDVAYITDEADSAQAASRVFAGDVLLNITGASIGRTSIVPTPFPQANVNQHVCILRPVRNLVTPEYLHLLLCSRQAKDQISSLENGTSREGLNFTQVGGLLFAFPPVQEQVAIVLTLAAKVGAIDRQSEKVLSVIERLVEYRSAVITNAVTGKIDVRGFAIPQPAEGIAL